MQNSHRNKLLLARFAVPNDLLAYAIFSVDLLIYTGLIVSINLVDAVTLKIVFGLLAGFFIAQLFIIGHDSAHSAYVRSRRANAIITRLCFLPALHNYSLWQFVHNRLHHAFTNVKGYNSWSPLSLTDYQAMPRWRQLLERLYRTPAGLGIYYLVERWYKDKFFPRAHTPVKYRASGWRDFGLNMLFLTGLVSGVSILAVHQGQNPLLAILFSVIVPFVVWNYAMGLTTYQQHIHPQLKWYMNLVEYRESVHSSSEVSIYMRYPSWYLFITHNCYVHPVHHVNARIPLYKLDKAQAAYMQAFPEYSHEIPFSVQQLIRTMETCKLYDYVHHQWLDFNGRPTTPARITVTSTESTGVIPLHRSTGS